jgi:hypothetical protein
MADSTFEIIHQHYDTEAEVSVNSKVWFYSRDTRHLTVNDAGDYEHFLNTRDLAGTAGKLIKFTDSNAAGNSLLTELSTSITMGGSGNGLVLFDITNATNDTSATAMLALHSSGTRTANLYTTPAAYTDNTQATERLTISTVAAMNGINLESINASGRIRFFYGTMAAGTLFATVYNKGLKLENIALSTDATNTVAGIDSVATITKNDSNSRQFYFWKLKPVLNTGGSNASTTLDFLNVDSTNTAVTGLTVNVANFMYGGLSLFKIVGTPDGSNNHNHQLVERLVINGSAPEMPLHIAADQTSLAGIAMQTSVDPGNPSDANQMRVYLKASKHFVIQYNDGGTTRYKSLDLTGTGVTWAHSTTSPT